MALNDVGGFRNTMTLVLTGLDIEAKAAYAEELLFDVLGGRDRFAEVDVRLLRFDRPDAPSNEQATAHLRVTVKDPDPRKVGRAFSNATMELALGGYAGFHTTTPPSAESAFGVYRPAAVPRIGGGASGGPAGRRPGRWSRTRPPGRVPGRLPAPAAAAPVDGPTPPGPARRGRAARARATRAATRTSACGPAPPTRTPGCAGFLTAERVRELLGPEAAELDVEVHDLPNLRAVNVVVHGLLGDGVAASTRPDPQAKGLGEYLRSRVVDVPESLLS